MQLEGERVCVRLAEQERSSKAPMIAAVLSRFSIPTLFDDGRALTDVLARRKRRERLKMERIVLIEERKVSRV